MAGVNTRKCCSCCTACPDSAVICTPCGDTSLCTPRLVRVVFSGISTACYLLGGQWLDSNGATLSGTFTLVSSATCTWRYGESPGTSFNFRELFSGTAGAPTCSGAVAFQNLSWTAQLTIVTVSGTTYIKLSLSDRFAGRAVFSSTCSGTLTINNGTDPDFPVPGGSGGSATVTFCP
jgi:hypothetical protein